MAASDEAGGFWPSRWSVDLNWLGLHSLTGAAVGLVMLGGGARVSMRLAAVIAGLPPALTAAGTVGILVMGAVAGALLGLLYAPFGKWGSLNWAANGLIFGLAWTAIAALPFAGDLGGEAALVAPWIGASLFAPLLLFFGPALAFALHRLEPRMARVERHPVGVLWLALYSGAWLFAFAGMASAADGGRIPNGMRRVMEGVGVPFHALRDAHSMLYLLLMLAFLGLHLVAFWLGARQQQNRTLSPVQAVSLAQLVLAGLMLRADPLWQHLAATSSGSAGEWLAWALASAALAVAIGWLLRQRARDSSSARRQWTWLAGGVACFVGGFLLAWLAVLLTPDLQLRNWTALQTALTVPPFVLPWLCLPAALIGAAIAAGPSHG